MSDSADKGSWKDRVGVFGDLPTRFLLSGLKNAPWFIEWSLVPIWTLVFFGLAGEQRRAVVSNLGALFPEWSGFRRVAGAYRVFLNFAWTYVDAMRCEAGTGDVDWVVDGIASFEELAALEEGSLILTAHMGNYDMAAALFASNFGRTVYAVRAPERVAEMQKIKEAELKEKERENPFFRTLYNTDGDMLGVELARLLGEGHVVAIQGDRVMFEVSSMEVEVEPGLVVSLPRGPLFLARVSKAAVYPLFILRDGWRRYRVQVSPALELPPRRRGPGEDPASQIWAETILDVVRPNWDQWFVFEPVLKRVERSEAC